LWVPTVSVETARVATPEFSVPVPSVAFPWLESVKVTVPVGVPPPGLTAATVAVKVTVWPAAEGLGESVCVIVVAAWLTSWPTVEALDPK
jgi:hypothetical protein